MIMPFFGVTLLYGLSLMPAPILPPMLPFLEDARYHTAERARAEARQLYMSRLTLFTSRPHAPLSPYTYYFHFPRREETWP